MQKQHEAHRTGRGMARCGTHLSSRRMNVVGEAGKEGDNGFRSRSNGRADVCVVYRHPEGVHPPSCPPSPRWYH